MPCGGWNPLVYSRPHGTSDVALPPELNALNQQHNHSQRGCAGKKNGCVGEGERDEPTCPGAITDRTKSLASIVSVFEDTTERLKSFFFSLFQMFYVSFCDSHRVCVCLCVCLRGESCKLTVGGTDGCSDCSYSWWQQIVEKACS